jgi:hypothetical protein
VVVVVANCERRRDDANKDEVVGIIDVGGRERVE